MKRMPYRSKLFWIFLVFILTTASQAETLSGRVYEGEYPSEPPTAQGLSGVSVKLYASYSSGVLGDEVSSYTTGSDGWYGLETEQNYEFFTIVCEGKSGYTFQDSSSIDGSASGEEIEYVVPLDGKTLTGNKFWYLSDTAPPSNNPPVADAGGPYSTQVGMPVMLDGSGSYDPDTGDSITGYQWYWFYQGNYNPINGVQTTPTIWWVPPVAGQVTVKLEVTDSHGESDTDTATVTVEEGGEPPAGTGTLDGYKRDADTQAGLEGWRIYIDINGNGQWDEGEPYDMTDSNGYYRINQVEPGTYRVCEEMQDGWEPAGGGSACMEAIDIIAGTTTTQDFHNRRTQQPPPGSDEGSVVVIKEATPKDDTPFLFCADYSPGSFFNTLCQNMQDPSNNIWTINNPELLQKVSETVTTGWTLTDITITGDTDNGSTIDLANATVNVDFDEGENIVVTFKNTKDGVDQGPGGVGDFVWNDLNQNGIQDTGEPGIAGAWVDIWDESGIPYMGTATDASGKFTIVNLPPGKYYLDFYPPPGTNYTFSPMHQGTDPTKDSDPDPTGRTQLFTVLEGEINSDIDAGMYQADGISEIHGMKWHDLNGNRVLDAGEPGLSGWQIILDYNQDGVLDPSPFSGDLITTTDASGYYSFTASMLGQYIVGEILQTGWQQTYPTIQAGGGMSNVGLYAHTVNVTSGQVILDVDFGNKYEGTEEEYDFGDAPDSYGTLKASGGPYHNLGQVMLGSSVDAETDGQPSPLADADSDDGVTFITPIMPNQPAEVEVITASGGYLDAWIDFDADGSWSQASDQVFHSEAVQAGSNIFSFHAPASIAIDIDTYARFRFSSAGGLSPNGAAPDGEVEDYHILLGENGPGVPGEGRGEGELPHVKWSQPPIEIDPNINVSPIFCGWNEPARSTEQSGSKRLWRMDADDFRCLGPIPITRIRWFGGYKAWTKFEPPELQPETWHIGIWANQAEGVTQYESYPEHLVWSLEIPAERVHFKPVGLEEFPEELGETCFVYEVELEPEEWFHQAEFESNDDVFWITITAVYPADAQRLNMWGWLTRPHVWGNGAVMPNIMGDWPNPDERLFPGRIYPIENSLLCGQNQAYDMCFELLTEEPWVKWDQPFTGIREWQDYSDNKSMALELPGGEPQKLCQVADDWFCERSHPVIAIAWNGSYIGYGYEACKCENVPEPSRPDYFLLSINENTSGTESNNYPGEKIWEFKAQNYDEVLAGYDKNPDGEPNEPVFRYCVRLPEDAWFRQETPESIYWFSVIAVYKESADDIPYEWGWTNHSHTFGSSALSIDSGSPATPQWQPMIDSDAQPVDMSFELFTAPEL